MKHTLNWFIKRINKRIFRLTKRNCCSCCKEIEENGLIIVDKNHADYLYCCQNEMDLEYSDKK